MELQPEQHQVAT